MRSTAAFLSTSGYETLENDHLLFPFTSVLVTKYMDSSFLMDLKAMSSLISNPAAMSEMEVSVPTES